MVLPKLTFVLLCAPFLSPPLVGDDKLQHGLSARVGQYGASRNVPYAILAWTVTQSVQSGWK